MPAKVTPSTDIFLKNFKKFRIKHIDKVQTAAADKLGITKGHLSNIENGSKRPSLELIEKLIRDYHINIEWLSTGLGNEQTSGPGKATAATSLGQAHTDIMVMQQAMKIFHVNTNKLYDIIEQQQKQIDALQKRLDKMEDAK